MDTKRPSARRFAAAMAERLELVVPRGLSVRAEGHSVDVFGEKTERHASAAAAIIEDEGGRPLLERIETAAGATLSGAQDAVMEILTEQWPLGPNGGVLYPNVRVDGDRLFMWFREERTPVIALSPLDVADVLDAGASSPVE